MIKIAIRLAESVEDESRDESQAIEYDFLNFGG